MALKDTYANILQNKEIEIWGDGSIIRDYVYVKDVADSIVNALNSIDGASIYNIGSGEGISLNGIIEEMRNVTNIPINVSYKPSRTFDVPVNVLDITQAKMKIGYSPKVSLREGISRTWNWIQNQKFDA